jgi:TonB family protein
MNCEDIAIVMDRLSRATLTERRSLEEHLAACPSCAFAWQAQCALLTLRVPEMSPALLDRALRTVETSTVERRRRRAPFALGAAFVAFGAAATMTLLPLIEPTAEKETENAAAAADSPPPRTDRVTGGVTPSGTSTPGEFAPTTATAERVDADFVLVVRTPPDYPLEGLARRLSGSVTLRYDIAATGAVENVTVVDSSDPMFDAPSIRAVSGWKFLPRIAAGKRVHVRDAQTVLRFEVAAPASPQPTASAAAQNIGASPKDRAFEIAWERVAANDVRGAELELDELRATYELDANQEGEVYDFYGYLYTLYGDYGRAIEAYETAIATYAGVERPVVRGRWLPLANLYYARHQYDKALETLLAYRQRLARLPGSPARDREIDAFVERLRALGVTEETL